MSNFQSSQTQCLFAAAKIAQPRTVQYNRLTSKEFGDKNSAYVSKSPGGGLRW